MTVEPELRIKNATLRNIRHTLRMSQTEFATAINRALSAMGEPGGCNKRLVQKWESGEHGRVRPNYQRALQAVTHLPYSRLGFANSTTGPASFPDLTPILTSHRPAAPGSPTATAPGLGVESGDRLRYALDKAAGADAAVIELTEATTAHLYDREHHEPARHLADAVDHHTVHIATLLTGTRPEKLRRTLASTAGQSAALAGWLAFDRNQTRDAHRHWDNALACARYAGDGPLLACIFTFMSYTAEQRGDPATAWHLARSAAVHIGTDPRACSWAHARAAQQAAVLGDVRAARADLDRALNLGADPSPEHEDGAPWIRFHDPCGLAGMATGVYTRLGDHAAALVAAKETMRLLGHLQVKSRAVAMAEAARAVALSRDLDHTVTLGTEALNLTERLECTLARRILRTLIPVLKPHSGHPPARTLLARLNGIPA